MRGGDGASVSCLWRSHHRGRTGAVVCTSSSSRPSCYGERSSSTFCPAPPLARQHAHPLDVFAAKRRDEGMRAVRPSCCLSGPWSDGPPRPGTERDSLTTMRRLDEHGLLWHRPRVLVTGRPRFADADGRFNPMEEAHAHIIDAMRRIAHRALTVVGVLTAVGCSPRPPEASSHSPAHRLSVHSRELLEEVQTLQRRVARLQFTTRRRTERAEVAPATSEQSGLEDFDERLRAVEIALAGLLSRISARTLDIGARYRAIGIYERQLLDPKIDAVAARHIWGKLASMAGCGPLMSDAVCERWLEIAYVLRAEPGFGSHLVSARHVAPRSAAVRQYLIGILLYGSDVRVRSEAMMGLGHCVWDRDVASAMQEVASSGCSLSRSAASWLRETFARPGR